MILLTNGDSWTQGDSPAQKLNWEATKSLDWYDIPKDFGNYQRTDNRTLYKFYDSEVWPKVLGRNLNLKTYNAGRLGDDNSGIARRTINILEKFKSNLPSNDISNFFVVIGWTSCLREDIFEKDENGKVFLSQARPANYYEETLPTPVMYEDKLALNIYLLQSYLENNNIKFLFFNAFDKFNLDISNFKSLVKKEYWINNDPTSAHFNDFIFKKFNIDSWKESKYIVTGHPTDISHIEWGKFLTGYIKENYEFN